MSRIQRARAAEVVAKVVTGVAAAAIVSVAVFILGYILYKGAAAIGWTFLTAPPRMAMRAGGIMPAIVGTFLLVTLTAAFALPIGVFAGVYLSEYAKRGRATRTVRLAIANMAGVPSIVYGLFGVALFVYAARFGVSLLSGSLTLACLTLPVVVTTTEEALRQVPSDLRQASLALGATRWRTTYRVVLPAALPGVVTGSVLGLSRAAGETAPILFTAVVFFSPRLPRSALSPVMALPYHLYVLLTQVPQSAATERIAWGTALVLVAGVSAVNLTAAAWRSARRRRVRW